jgi:hypothetical protein
LEQLTCIGTDSLQGFSVELAAAGFVGRFQLLSGGIQQLAHILTDLGERALAAEHFDAHGLQILGRTGGLDAGQGGGFEIR